MLLLSARSNAAPAPILGPILKVPGAILNAVGTIFDPLNVFGESITFFGYEMQLLIIFVYHLLIK